MSTCGRLGCSKTATHEIRQPHDKPIRRCSEHVDETAEVHAKFTNRQSEGVTIVKLRGRAR